MRDSFRVIITVHGNEQKHCIVEYTELWRRRRHPGSPLVFQHT